ncbi:type II toxin-antitoxin system PemK/MazF family toxin [Thermoflexibacter ruber]|uniref:mRNA interferase MazF n=1 Tax=Thermoflexibacter ruber TaxID=1003 RepID=A0A1I2HCP4_9BACT|nr:type II toxin-antitoxin system PemK/MazF family toxin [Thermoflexibacter ruber]SFF27070.1 mRNA interferase MazF [Thermoflexibacter ruber]
MYRFGDMVLIAFPYSNNEGNKKRPALVLLDAGDDDVLLARVTSQYTNTNFDVEINEWQQAGLLVPSYVRLHKLATLEKVLIDRRLGYLSSNDLSKVASKLNEIFGDL